MDEYTESLKAANEQLMTCPFCGSKAHIEEHLSNTYGVICDNENCLAKSDQYYGTMDEAVAAWNTRVADDKPVVKGEWVHRKVWHPLPWDCPPDYGEEYDSESHSRLEDEWHCSNCDYETDVIHKEWWNFCPNCGADMRKEVNNAD